VLSGLSGSDSAAKSRVAGGIHLNTEIRRNTTITPLTATFHDYNTTLLQYHSNDFRVGLRLERTREAVKASKQKLESTQNTFFFRLPDSDFVSDNFYFFDD
jgi:hypothetical protein